MTNKTQHTKKAALCPEWSGRWVCLSGLLPGRCGSDGRGCRSDGRLRRPGSAKRSNARRTSPHGDGDSDVAQLRSGWLSSRSNDDSVGTTPLPADGPSSRPRFGEPIVRHSSCCLRRRPRRQPTCLGSQSRPAGRRSTLRSPGNSEQEPQFPADSGGNTHNAELHFANQSHLDSALSLSLLAHSVEPHLNSPYSCGDYTHCS